jgi:hypothetical protein
VKHPADHFTRDLIDKAPRGRPRKPDAKSAAQRAREYRARQREKPQGPRTPNPYRMRYLLARVARYEPNIDSRTAQRVIEALWAHLGC